MLVLKDHLVTESLSSKTFWISSDIESETEPLHVGHNRGEDGPIDHSSHLSVVDPEGNFVAAMRPPHRSRDLVKALRIVTGK